MRISFADTGQNRIRGNDMDDLIERQAAIDAIAKQMPRSYTPDGSHPADEEIYKIQEIYVDCIESIEILPAAQPDLSEYSDKLWKNAYERGKAEAQSERDIPKRVSWTGWKGCRDTRYRCPSCKKPVRNTDVYCHRCGQKLMFPHISFTDYVPGEKQQTIVRWDDDNNGID